MDIRSQDFKHCSMIYRIEGVLDIQIQHHRDTTTSPRSLYEALQFCDLSFVNFCQGFATPPRGGIKELAVTSGIVSIFRASAGVVTWTGAELDEITKVDSSVQAGVGILDQHG